MRLPSKKFTIIILATVVIGTGLFFVLELLTKKETFTQNEPATPLSAQEKGASVFGELTVENEEPLGLQSQNYGNGTVDLTDTLSRELLTALILTGKTDVGETEISNALASLFEKSAQYEIPRIYSENNIQKTETTRENLKRYGNEFMDTVAKRAEANAANTLGAFENALKTQSDNAIKTLRALAEEYRKMESSMLSVKVPEKIALLHLDFINTLRAIENAVTDMGFVLTDPVRGTLGLTAYVKQLDRAWLILNGIQEIFESEKIEFTANESGNRWKGFK